jgi:membrane protein
MSKQAPKEKSTGNPSNPRLLLALAICRKSCSDMLKDGCFTQAAAISYYLVVSIFPLLLLLIGVAGFFLEPQDTQYRVMGWLRHYFPTGTRAVFRENIQAIVAARSSISILSSLSLLWSGTLMFDAVNEAVNAAWGARGHVRFIAEKLKSLAFFFLIMFVAAVSTLLTTQVALITRFEYLLRRLPGAEWWLLAGRSASSLLWWVIPLLLSAGAFGLAYRLLPREDVTFKDVWLSALVAAVLWDLSKRGFVWYITVHTSYTKIYGSLSAVLILMLWAYLSALILIWGAELSAEIWKSRRGLPAE